MEYGIWNTKHRASRTVILFLAFFIFLFPGLPTQALSQIDEFKNLIEQRNKEIEALEAKAKLYKNVIGTSQKEAASLKNQLETIDKTIKNLNIQNQITVKKIANVKTEINKLSIEINGKQSHIKRNKETLVKLAQKVNRNDDQETIISFMNSDTLSDFYSNTENILKINDLLLNQVKILKDLERGLSLDKNEEEDKKESLEDLKTELDHRKKINNSQKETKKIILTQTKNQEKKYKSLLTEVEKIYNQVQEEIETLEEKLRLAIDPKSLPPARNGFFDWPIKNKITSPYGNRIHPIGNYLKFHNGIDIRASIGDSIRAPYNGKVLAKGDSDQYCRGGSYGKWLVIDHENNLATMYSHLSSINVTNNQTIKKGQIIAFSGNTGYSSGPHLHFSIFDRRTIDIRQSRVCGILPYGGSVNPMDYL